MNIKTQPYFHNLTHLNTRVSRVSLSLSLSLSILSLTMADEPQYSSDGTPSKRKYEDQTTPPSAAARRPTGFSAPDPAVAPPSYNSVPPPADEFQDFQAAKRRAEQIAARLCNSVSAEAKRPRVENGAGGFDSADKGFSSPPSGIFTCPRVPTFSLYFYLISFVAECSTLN